MSVPATIAIAVGAFTACKLAFGFLGWYSKSSAHVGGGSRGGRTSDDLYRDRLYALWDRLHLGTFFDVAHAGLMRLEVRVRQKFKTRRRAIFLLALTFLIVNLISILIALYMRDSLRHGALLDHIGHSIPDWFSEEDSPPTWVFLCVAMLLTLIDLISADISWYFLKRAARSRRLRHMLLHGMADAAIAFVAVACSLLLLPFFNMRNTGVVDIDFFLRLYGHLVIDPIRTIQEFLDPPLVASGIFMGLSASIPTVAHSSVVIGALFAYLAPDWLRKFTMRCISLVVKDDKPVLSQLGTVVGGIAALLAALGSLLAKL